MSTGEYTVSQMADLFNVNQQQMYGILRLCGDCFPQPTAPRIVPGQRIPVRFYPSQGVDAVRVRYEQSRRNGEPAIAVFRRIFNVPRKISAVQRTSSPATAAVNGVFQRLESLETKVDQILEIMKRLV